MTKHHAILIDATNLLDNASTDTIYTDFDDDFEEHTLDGTFAPLAISSLETETLKTLHKAMLAELTKREQPVTDFSVRIDDDLPSAGEPLGNELSHGKASPIADGLTFEFGDKGPNPDNSYVNGPVYTAAELRVIATHTIVGLCSAAGVGDAVRLEAATWLAANTTDLETEASK